MKGHLKQLFLFIFIVLIGSCLACQPTPTVEPIPNKADNKMEAAIHTTPIPAKNEKNGFAIPSLNVPDRWVENLTIGRTNVIIDASIDYKDVAHPVFLIVDEKKINKDVMTSIVNEFVNPLMWREVGTTRDELLEELNRAILGEPTGEYDPQTGEQIYVPYEGQKEEIERINKQLQEVGTEIQWTNIQQIPQGEGVLSDGSISRYYYLIDQHFAIREDRMIQFETDLRVKQQNYIGQQNTDDEGIPDPVMTRDEAIKKTEQMLSILHLNQRLDVAYTTKCRARKNDEVLGIGWQVTCMLSSEGAKLFSSQSYDYNGGPIAAKVDGNVYHPSTTNETMNFYFIENDLKGLTWDYPETIISVENAAVELLPFDQIQMNIKKRFEYGLSWLNGEDLGQTIYVKEIALSYLKTAKINDRSGYYWTPVWAVIYECDDMMPVKPFIFYINAIDGTFIIFE